MKFVVSRDPHLSPGLLWPSLFTHVVPRPVSGRATSFHFLARNAMYHGLQSLGVQQGDKVLVPAFHCGTLVEPVLQVGCEVEFYNVNRDGSIDFDDLAKRVDGQTKAIIAIHYFGTLQPIQQLQDFCRERNVFFVEDCAHILMGELDGHPIGSSGDISIFSWRKFFPMFDGGVLVHARDNEHFNIDWEKVEGWCQLKVIKHLLEKCVDDFSSPRNRAQVLAKAAANAACHHQESPSADNEEASLTAPIPEFDSSRVNWPMSFWSHTVLKNSNVELILKRRKENTIWLSEAIRSLTGASSWVTDGQASMCAWAFPLHIPNRKDVHVELRKRGGQAFSWGGVIHPRLQLEQFPDAQYLYEHLVLLPNHQNLTREEMTWMIEQLKDVLQTPNSVCEPAIQ